MPAPPPAAAPSDVRRCAIVGHRLVQRRAVVLRARRRRGGTPGDPHLRRRDERGHRARMIVGDCRAGENDLRRTACPLLGQCPGVRELACGRRSRHVPLALPWQRQQRIRSRRRRPGLRGEPCHPQAIERQARGLEQAKNLHASGRGLRLEYSVSRQRAERTDRLAVAHARRHEAQRGKFRQHLVPRRSGLPLDGRKRSRPLAIPRPRVHRATPAPRREAPPPALSRPPPVAVAQTRGRRVLPRRRWRRATVGAGLRTATSLRARLAQAILPLCSRCRANAIAWRRAPWAVVPA